MKTRVRKNSDSEWVESLPDTSTLPNLKTANSLSRQECICDLEEKLHKAFANARYEIRPTWLVDEIIVHYTVDLVYPRIN